MTMPQFIIRSRIQAAVHELTHMSSRDHSSSARQPPQIQSLAREI